MDIPSTSTSIATSPASPLPFSFVGHQFVRDRALPPYQGPLYEWLVASNGLFKRGRREGIAEAVVPVITWQNGLVGGLGPVLPHLDLDLPPVPASMLRECLLLARYFAEDAHGAPLEDLFHFTRDARGTWECHEPEQDRTASSCQPYDDGHGSTFARSLLDLHSHHTLPAIFSETDNRDERDFRLYGVLGCITTDRPQIRMRVGVFGHYLDVPAAWIFADFETLGIRDMTLERETTELDTGRETPAPDRIPESRQRVPVAQWAHRAQVRQPLVGSGITRVCRRFLPMMRWGQRLPSASSTASSASSASSAPSTTSTSSVHSMQCASHVRRSPHWQPQDQEDHREDHLDRWRGADHDAYHDA